MKLNDHEMKLLEYAKKRIPVLFGKRRERGVLDTLFAFVISDSGKIYEGKSFESEICNGPICCERGAIANMALEETEKARIKSVLVFGPVGKEGNLTPCGLCRAVIHEYSDGKATILCTGGYFERKDTDFEDIIKKNLRKFTIKELYPEPWVEGKWK
jgi:cytidine deaminase